MNRRRSAIAAALFLVGQGTVVPQGFAQQPGETERLLRIIEEQQRRLDAQEAQIEEQRKALQGLRLEVEALHRGTEPVAAPAAPASESPATAAVTEAAPAAEEPPPPGYEGLKKAVTAAQKEWPGSFALFGTDTRVQISGFVELDVMHDTDAIVTPSAFVTKGIVTRDATDAQGADGQTNFSVQASRLSVETRTPVLDRQLRTFTAVDWFDDFGTTKPNIRLREAYGEASDILFGGDLLLGQAWSTYTNLYSTPNVLDFQGPNALLGTRHPMARWTRPLRLGMKLMLAAEAPDGRNFEDASSASRWPDGVLALGWEQGAYNLQGSFLARDLRASGDSGTDAAFGWGTNVAGRIHMPGALAQDFSTFSLTYGEGIGGVFNDTPPDASYDVARGVLKAIPTLGGFASYQHWWNPSFYSVVSYGYLRQDNLGFQAPTAYKRTHYATGNLSWTPAPQWLFGVEAMYGSREDKDGADGSVVRTQFTSRFMF